MITQEALLIIVVLCGFQWFGCNQHLSPPNYHYLLCKTQQEPGVHIISSLSASHCGPAVCLCWGQEGSYSGCCGQRPSVYALPLLTAFSVCEVWTAHCVGSIQILYLNAQMQLCESKQFQVKVLRKWINCLWEKWIGLLFPEPGAPKITFPTQCKDRW